MTGSDRLVESEAQREGRPHCREAGAARHARGDADSPLQRPGNGSHGDPVGGLAAAAEPRRRRSRDRHAQGGNGRMDADDKYVKYGRKRRKRRKDHAVVVGASVCIGSFLLGFAWMHFPTTQDESSQSRPQLRRPSPGTKPMQQPLLIPRFDARKSVPSWEERARGAALQQAGQARPRSVRLEEWNAPVAFRTFPRARQTHDSIKNLDRDYGGITYHSVRSEEKFARVIPKEGSVARGTMKKRRRRKAAPGAFDPDSIAPDRPLKRRNARRRKYREGSHPNLDSRGRKVLKPRASYEEIQSFYDDDTVHVWPEANDGKTRKTRACQQPAFSTLYFPTCNAFHEHDLGRAYDDPALFEHPRPENESYRKYLAHGYFRDVWILEDNPWVWPGESAKEKDYVAQKYDVIDEERTNEMVAKAYRSAALKTLQLQHAYDGEHFQEVRNEAVIMERLTSSPRIMDVYGHCVYSTMAEVVPIEFEEVSVPGEGYYDREEVEKRNADGVRPYNDFTGAQKLRFALEMAESLADLHGFPDGVIVHDDVQPCQWLQTPDGHLKLGDFNRATIMQWDNVAGGYCKFNNGEAHASYRAPEEYAVKNLDEQIDVFSFGNNLYGMLTGLWNFYDTDDNGVNREKLIDGERAYIDPRYKERSFADRTLVDLMERCWEYDPDDRISIFEAVDVLRKAVEENGKEEAQ